MTRRQSSRPTLVPIAALVLAAGACADGRAGNDEPDNPAAPPPTTIGSEPIVGSTPAISEQDRLFVQAWPELAESIATDSAWTGTLDGYLVLPANDVKWQLCRGGTESGDCEQPLAFNGEPVVVELRPEIFRRMTDNPATEEPVNIMSDSSIKVVGTFNPEARTFEEDSEATLVLNGLG
jgi:hypothetical protein